MAKQSAVALFVINAYTVFPYPFGYDRGDFVKNFGLERAAV